MAADYFLWSSYTSTFGVSGRVSRLLGKVFGSRQNMFPVAEMAVAVTEGMAASEAAVLACRFVGKLAGEWLVLVFLSFFVFQF